MQIKEGTIKVGERVKIKISGDGARMSQMTNFILLSFNVLQQVDDILSSRLDDNEFISFKVIFMKIKNSVSLKKLILIHICFLIIILTVQEITQ